MATQTPERPVHLRPATPGAHAAVIAPRRQPGVVRGRDRGVVGGVVKAVLGPTNTGKTHLAIERLCAHSSGAIGFPLRLLAREVYEKVVALKGRDRVALITGEERIEPPQARWLLCTAEAMPARPDLAFVALDEVQLAADPERGHIFTDRLLHTRGREETMLLGSGVVEPLVRALVPEAEIVSRPRFSTLSHAGARKLSRIPPRSAIVAFSAEQVYAVAEMLRRFRGGAAVVMGALSPQTRNAQVALYQAGEVDYLVATDAIGMGLNLDVHHVAFAGLGKFDGRRHRRLTLPEMAQIAGRAGRHQRDGTFGTVGGIGGPNGGGVSPEFSDEEVHAIEEHRFAPLTRLFWREAEPRCDDLPTLIAELETPPDQPELAPAPEAIDLAVLRRLADDPAVAATVRGAGAVRRLWQVCSLPDFRQQGAETHARFVARLWQDLAQGYLGKDYVASAIANLDNPAGDIDTLQGRIAAIRSWAYIAQRPDWVLAREDLAERARAVETRLSDALHARLTERFVNRRTAVLMRKLGADAGLLPVRIDDKGVVMVDDEPIGHLEGFRFVVDPAANAADHKLLLAAAEKHLPRLLDARVTALEAAAEANQELVLDGATLLWNGERVGRLERGKALLEPKLRADAALDRLTPPERIRAVEALAGWLQRQTGAALAPLRALAEASRAADSGPALRALLIRLVEQGGTVERADSGLDRLEPAQRDALRGLGIKVGALDVYVPQALRPAAVVAWQRLAQVWGLAHPAINSRMVPVVDAREPVLGYRRAGAQAIRVDCAEKLIHAAHQVRTSVKPGAGANARGRRFALDPALARSVGMTTASYAQLLRAAGFRVSVPPPLPEGAFGPPAPPLWDWRPVRPNNTPEPTAVPQAPATGAFAALAGLIG